MPACKGRLKTGTTDNGLRWASLSGYRVVAWALGGYSCQRHVDGIGWCLLDGAMPEAIERALCKAVGVTYEA